jgi:hypothetical protein
MEMADLLPDPAMMPKASARFFLGVARAARASEPKDVETLPLFSLPMIMEAEGLLAADASHLARGV